MAFDPKIVKSTDSAGKQNSLKTDGQSFKAYVVANYGDPGLEQNIYCDILSRYVIAVKDPLKIPVTSSPITTSSTTGSYGSIHLQDNIILVRRPQNLWISCPSGSQSQDFSSYPIATNKLALLKRQDAAGNQNIGYYGSYSESNILPINRTYKLGEEITVQKLQDYLSPDDDFFTSIFPDKFSNNSTYYDDDFFANIQKRGIALPNTIVDGKLVGGGKDTSLFNASKRYFCIKLSKKVYEDFIKSFYQGSRNLNSQVAYGFNYYFKLNNQTIYTCCSYIDVNSDSKARESSSSCLPTIVAPPDSFLTPKQRTTQTITYSYI